MNSNRTTIRKRTPLKTDKHTQLKNMIHEMVDANIDGLERYVIFHHAGNRGKRGSYYAVRWIEWPARTGYTVNFQLSFQGVIQFPLCVRHGISVLTNCCVEVGYLHMLFDQIVGSQP